MRLKDRVVLVTGAAGGIGLASARRFLAEGAKVKVVGPPASPVSPRPAVSGRS